MSRYSCCNRRKGGGKTVIAMYTCKDNLTPLLYSGKIKKIKKERKKEKEKESEGVPVMAQWLTNLTRNHEVASSIPSLVQWVGDLALL